MTLNKPKLFYGYIIALASFIILALVMGGLDSFGVFFEPVLVEFGWTRAMTSGAFSLALIVSGLLSMGVGRLNDRIGPRLILTASGLFSGLGFLLMSRISVIWQLYLFFGAMIGIAVSGSVVASLSTIARWFVKRRGMMTGFAMAGTGAGSIIMPLLLNRLISNYGWRASFFAVGIISLVVIVIAAQFTRRNPQSKGQLPDGEAEVKQENSQSEVRGLSLREASRTRQLWLFTATFFCLGFSIFSVMVHIVIHATGLGIATTSAVSTLPIIGGLSTSGRIMMGITSDKIGSRKALIISLFFMLVALIWLQFAKEAWMLYIFAAFFGFAWGSSFVLMSPMIADLFGLSSHGVLFGVVQAGMTLGAFIGPIATGYIFDITGSYRQGFLILGVVGVIGLILAVLLQLAGTNAGEYQRAHH